MKKLVLSIALLSTLSMGGLAQSTQTCIIKKYNQKQQKTPLSGVEVVVSNAGTAISASDGKITLTFRTLKPGDHINLIHAKKAGYEIMNKGAVEQWNISRDGTPFTIVMVRSDYFAQLKGKLTNACTENYKAKYEKAVRELEKQKKENKLKEAEYNHKYDSLEANYQNQLNNLENRIDHFARIDLSEVSIEEQRIFEMVEEGKLDEAVKAYEDMGILSKLAEESEVLIRLSNAPHQIDIKLEQEKNIINNLIETILRQVSALILAEKGNEAEELFVSMLQKIIPLQSKGDILLTSDQERKIGEMWNKLIEFDPAFFEKYKGTKALYQQLKKKDLVK